MSEIGDRIAAYQAGTLSEPDLVDYLASHHYAVPERDATRPADPALWYNHSDEAPRYTDGSWDEVRRAMDTGKLPRPIYMPW